MKTLRSILVVVVISLAALLPAPVKLTGQAEASFAQPGISPDGTQIAFVSGGDIWTVPANGGVARLLIAHSASEQRPLYSPDGRWLAFNSDREGSTDVWVMDLHSGALHRRTVQDGTESLDGWSPDSKWVYFSSSRTDVQGNSDVFRVRVSGGTPMPVLGDRYESEFFAAPGPQDQILLSTRGRMAQGQWWRNGHAHIDEAEIWLARFSDEDAPTYVRVNEGGKNSWPMWGADGSTIYWISDRDGAENLWTATASAGATAQRLTDFSDGRAIWPTISRAGDAIAFERDFGIWTYTDGVAREVPITLMGAVQGPRTDFRSVTSFSEVSLSPDGKKLGLVARGEVFAAPADSGGPARRVTHTAAPERQVTWDADSEKLAYVSTRGEYSHVYLYDFTTGVERQLTSGDANDVGPEFSPDGNQLAVLREGHQLVVVDLESGNETVVAEGLLAFAAVFASPGNYEWSPDGEWLAYLAWPTGEFGNVHIVPAGGGESRVVSFLANVFSGSLDWSGDGKFIVFESSQRTEDGNLFRVDLTPRVPAFKEDRFTALFDTISAGDSAPVEISFEEIRSRMSVISTGLNVGSVVLSPDTKTAVVSAFAEGRQNLYAIDIGPLARGTGVPRQLTATTGGKGNVQFTPDGKEVLYLQGGSVRRVPLGGGSVRTVGVTAEIEVDFDAEKMDVFLQGWRTMRDGFYDENLHGADWDAVRTRFGPHIQGAQTVAEMRRILQLMIGELNGSHLGAGGPTGITQTPSGALGLHFDRVEYERTGRLRVTEVLPRSPAAVSGGVKIGDYLVSVNGVGVTADQNLNRLFLETVGERMEVGFADAPEGDVRVLVMKPISNAQEAQLRYRAWVEGRRAYVDEISGGRLGYVHMANMGTGALSQLYLDLDQENHNREGVVVDIRNNNGGFVNAYALDVFTRQSYFTMRPRGGLETSSRTQLGQRALLAPTVLVTNQHTLSDGEDFAEGYRQLHLGPVVGEPTAGWIIYTSSVTLFDGTRFRLPFIEVRGADGEVMERNPRPVDIEVERPAGESYTGRDAQLERAVVALLAGLGN
jgi:tricorn protease